MASQKEGQGAPETEYPKRAQTVPVVCVGVGDFAGSSMPAWALDSCGEVVCVRSASGWNEFFPCRERAGTRARE